MSKKKVTKVETIDDELETFANCQNCGNKVCSCEPDQTLKEKIVDFLEYMNGKIKMNTNEQQTMYRLYNEAYGKNEKNIGCDICAIRIFQSLRNYI